MTDEDSEPDEGESSESEIRAARKRLEEGADKAIGEFDQSVVDLLAWLLDTETRARIYVYLRQNPQSTSEEVAEGSGLYPSTVREALADLHDEETVSRSKRESAGAGNNPYEYEAISPSDLVAETVGQVQNQLNAVFNLDDRLSRGQNGDGTGPVTISVSDESGDGDDATTGDGDDTAEGEDNESAADGDDDATDGDADTSDDDPDAE